MDTYNMEEAQLNPLIKSNHTSITDQTSILSDNLLNYKQTLVQSSLAAFNKKSPEIILTESQESTVNMCIRLLPDFKILVIKGETSSGKYVVASEVFKRLDAVVEYFDLCEIARSTQRELSNQDLVDYLDRLVSRLNRRMNNTIDNDSDERPRNIKRRRSQRDLLTSQTISPTISDSSLPKVPLPKGQ